jgi:hypothetical protein
MRDGNGIRREGGQGAKVRPHGLRIARRLAVPAQALEAAFDRLEGHRLFGWLGANEAAVNGPGGPLHRRQQRLPEPFHRNRNRIRTTSSAPSRRALTTLLTASEMKSACWKMERFTSIPAGNCFPI